MPTTIKGKITIAFSILITLALIGMGTYLYNYFTDFYMDNLEDQLLDKARMVANTTDFMGYPENERDNLQAYVEELGQDTDYRFTVIRDDGEVIAESNRPAHRLDNHLDRPEVQTAVREGVGVHTRFSETIEEDLLYTAVAIYEDGPDTSVEAFSRVAFPLTEIRAVRNNLALLITSGALFAVLLTWMFGSFIAQSITYPLERLTKWAKQISQGEFQGKYDQEFPLNSRGQDEVYELAFHFQEMNNSLQKIMDSLSEEKNKLALLLKNMPDGVIGVDEQQNIVLTNPAAHNLLGLSRDELNQPLIAVTRHYDLYSIVTQVIDHGVQMSDEINFGDRVIRLYATPVPRSNNSRGVVVILQDISDLTRVEQMKKEFISNISHELKTPLTSIQGFIETLIDETPEDHTIHQEFLQIIRDESDRVTRLVEDMTTLSKLETDSINFASRQVEVKSFVDRVVSISRKRWQNKDYKLMSQTTPEDVRANFDPDKIQQTVLNLIDNAFVHNPEGTKVKLKIVSRGDAVRFSVIDNGKGIPVRELERIFERFYRVDKSRDKNYGGTGLGLSIAKHILKAHDSDLQVMSKANLGTVFYFDLQ